VDVVGVPSPVAPVGLATQSGSAPALQPGQVIDALVLALLEDGSVRLALPDSIVDVRTAVPLVAGTTVRLAVKSSGPVVELAVVPHDGTPLPAAPAAPPGLAGVRSPATPDQRPDIRTAPSAGGGAVAEATPRTAADIAVARSAPLGQVPSELPAVAARTPVQAVGEAMRAAAARQDSVGVLMANVEQVVKSLGPTLPEPVVRAMIRLLDLKIPLDANLSGDDVKRAVARSGLFMEASLASADRESPGAAVAGVNVPDDMKAVLLVFRQAVRSWLDRDPAPKLPGGQSETLLQGPMKGAPVPEALADLDAPVPARAGVVAPTAVPNDPPPPPPYRGAPPTAQAQAAATLADDAAPREIGDVLIAQTDAALARHTLFQVASLPDRPEAGAGRPDAAQWAFEIPFAGQPGTHIAQFEISRDGRAAAADGQAVWRAKFSLNLEPLGAVHAHIALMGERAAVSLWAAREASAARLRDRAPMLADALRGAELEPGEIQCRTGAPAAPRAAPGRFFDRAS